VDSNDNGGFAASKELAYKVCCIIQINIDLTYIKYTEKLIHSHHGGEIRGRPRSLSSSITFKMDSLLWRFRTGSTAKIRMISMALNLSHHRPRISEIHGNKAVQKKNP